MADLAREHWFPLLGALRYVTDTFSAEAQAASEDAGVVGIHAALITLHSIAASHVGGVRPTGLSSTLLYLPPLAPDVTHTLTLISSFGVSGTMKLFPIESISIAIEPETMPRLPADDEGSPRE